MSAADPSHARTLPTTDEQVLGRHRGLFMMFGIAMVALGTFAITWSCLKTITLTATWIFGVLLIIGGVAEIGSAIRGGRGSHRLLHLLMGVCYLVVGFMIVDAPGRSAVQLTLVIALFMIFSGLFRVAFALSEPVAYRGWVLFNGVVTLALGVMIYKQWPSSGLWVIGLFLGIELILNGWAWIGLAIHLRPKAGTPVPAVG